MQDRKDERLTDLIFKMPEKDQIDTDKVMTENKTVVAEVIVEVIHKTKLILEYQLKK